ncbi:hypothetical protein H8Z60_06710 [Mycolicibacterium fortuitum]|nr:hypothetical protein [Mycolicibacterium fortuitum]
MSTQPYESHLDRVLREAGLPPADHKVVDQLVDQMVAVGDTVRQWDSPCLYLQPGARKKCLSVLKAHRFIGTEHLRYHSASWDKLGDSVIDLPAFNPDDPTQASVPRVIFAANPKSVRVVRGTLYDTLTGVMCSIAAQTDWPCDWGSHPISPQSAGSEVVWSKPYLVTKAMGEYLLVFVVCTQCLDGLIGDTRSANDSDRELIDGRWQPIYRNPRPNPSPKFAAFTMWDSNEHPENLMPAAYLMNGIRFVIPHGSNGWRVDDESTYDGLPH